MTIHSVFLKEHEGIAHNYIGAVPRWCGVGAQSPPAVTVHSDDFSQSKPAALEVSAAGSQFTVTKQPEDGHQGIGKGNTTDIFIHFYDDCKTTGNGAKTQLQTVTSIQAIEYPGHLELGFGQPQICAKYPYAEQCYGFYTTYGTQIAGRMMLPLTMTTDGGSIFVNPKQYNGILRRRKFRAKAEMENKVPKLRKPYQHLSRHLHAVRRARGSGGRFLNMKTSNESNEKNGEERIDKEEKQLPQSTESQVSEMLQSVVAINSKETNGSSRSTSSGSEAISHLFSRATTVHPFHVNHLHPSFQPFHPNLANTGLGIAMAAGNYLKV